MASGPHTFVVLGVFSHEQFQGNRLAIVAVRGNALTQQRKSLIAKEFGYTGTVFIHDAPNAGIPRRVEIFSQQGEELTFSGHCILGTTHYIFQCCELRTSPDRDRPLTTVLMTKAGRVPVQYNAQRQVAACSVPHDYHLHKARVPFDKIVTVQPQIQIVPTVEKCKDKTFPVVSILKGMTFSLIDLTDAPEVMGALEAGKAPETQLDEDWSSGYVGALYYTKKDALTQAGEPTIHSIQARVITHGIEDPGTGSACSALACYLALNEDIQPAPTPKAESATVDEVADKTSKVSLDGNKPQVERHVYAIQQGIEMGRTCTIATEIDLSIDTTGTRKVTSVVLSGKASFFVRGELMRI